MHGIVGARTWGALSWVGKLYGMHQTVDGVSLLIKDFFLFEAGALGSVKVSVDAVCLTGFKEGEKVFWNGMDSSSSRTP